LKYVDAGANLLDSMYRGTYHSKRRHEPDLDIVLRRAFERGVREVISLAGTAKESEDLAELIGRLDGDSAKAEGGEGVRVFGTVGVHPTRCAEAFAVRRKAAAPRNESEGGDPAAAWVPKTEQERDEMIRRLIRLCNEGKESGNVVAVGECGLDYARLQFCPKDIQHLGLRAQLRVASETNLPLYLHNRESGADLYDVLLEHRDELGDGDGNIRGIVHSFDESVEVAERFMSLGLYIGVNGCSLKTAENLEAVRRLPLERLVLETDCPWCDIRPSHAGAKYVRTAFPAKKEKQYNRELGREFCVKNRTEPCHVAQVAEVVAGAKGADVREVVEVCRRNVYDLFGGLEKR